MKTVVLFGIAALAFALNAAVSPNDPRQIKEPWQWSNEERIAARTDSNLASARVAAFRKNDSEPGRARALSSSAAEPSPPTVDIIDGNRNPELFLSTELFEHLMTLAFAVKDNWRGTWDEQARRRGLNRDFWSRLVSIAEPYVSELRWKYEILEQGRIGTPAVREKSNRQIVGLEPAICRDRFAALGAARAEFGPAFDQFLYEVVAAGLSKHVFGELPERSRLEKEARGCQ
jgi:hypothetical protein